MMACVNKLLISLGCHHAFMSVTTSMSRNVTGVLPRAAEAPDGQGPEEAQAHRRHAHHGEVAWQAAE